MTKIAEMKGMIDKDSLEIIDLDIVNREKEAGVGINQDQETNINLINKNHTITATIKTIKIIKMITTEMRIIKTNLKETLNFFRGKNSRRRSPN